MRALLRLGYMGLIVASVGWGHAGPAAAQTQDAELFQRAATAKVGAVVLVGTGCDYFILESADGDYAVLEWYGGSLADVGDVLVGDFETFGFQDVFNRTDRSTMHVWVEDYWLDRSGAIETLLDNCDGISR